MGKPNAGQDPIKKHKSEKQSKTKPHQGQAIKTESRVKPRPHCAAKAVTDETAEASHNKANNVLRRSDVYCTTSIEVLATSRSTALQASHVDPSTQSKQ
jgi:hypothetical protein